MTSEVWLFLNSIILLTLLVRCIRYRNQLNQIRQRAKAQFSLGEVGSANYDGNDTRREQNEIKIQNEYLKKLEEQRIYYEALLEGCKDRDQSYSFLVSRYDNEVRLRRHLERKLSDSEALIARLHKERDQLRNQLRRAPKKRRLMLRGIK